MGSITDFLETFVGRALGFGAVYGSLFALQVWKFNLLHQEAITFLIALSAWFVIWIVSVVNAGKALTVPAVLCLVWVMFSSTLPNTADAVTERVRDMDRRTGEAIRRTDEAAAERIAPPPRTVPIAPDAAPQTPEAVHQHFSVVIEKEPAPQPVQDDDGFTIVVPER